MSEKTVIGDEVLELELKNMADKFNISVDELIKRYIKRGLFTDDYYVPRKLTKEELIEISKRDVERDKKNGIFPKKRNSSSIIGIINK